VLFLETRRQTFRSALRGTAAVDSPSQSQFESGGMASFVVAMHYAFNLGKECPI